MSTLPEVRITALATYDTTTDADALVIGVVGGPTGPSLLANPLSAGAAKALSDSLGVLGITGVQDEVRRLPGVPGSGARTLVLTGLGKAPGPPIPAEALRRAAGSAVRQLARLSSVVLALPAASVAAAAAVAEGAALGAYSFTGRRSQDSYPAKPAVTTVTIITDAALEEALVPALARARLLGRAVNATRSLVNRSPNDLYPATFAEAARELVGELPVAIQVLDEHELKAGGYGGLTGVGKGSCRPPRLVKIRYAPPGARKSLAFVGKGITFDSGGISLKPSKSMDVMKSDMAGAAVVLNTVLAIAELGLPVAATGWLSLAENMPSGTALRPSDVITIFGGKTVEVLDTDAEGRLVMADALAAASAESPDIIIDVATLTGAQMVALGTRTGAAMGDDSVLDAVETAADRAGELFWRMPMPEELRPSLDSPVADLANMGGEFGGMLTAAVFLQEFIGNVSGQRIPWAHLDIAGPAYNEEPAYGYTPKGGTGMGVRTLVAFAEDTAARWR